MKKAISMLFGFCFMFSAGILISGCTDETYNTYNSIINKQAPEEALFGEWVRAGGHKYEFKPGIDYTERAYAYNLYDGDGTAVEIGFFIADAKVISFKITQMNPGSGLIDVDLTGSYFYEFTNNGQTLVIDGIGTFNKVS